MEKQLNKALEELILEITDSFEYKKCLSLKDKMSTNDELISLVNRVKDLQKKYIRSGYDDNTKLLLEEEKDKLNSFPIYVSYMQYLEIVNEKINYVTEYLNDYFYEVLNK